MSFYFDNAATTFPKPECVYSVMDSFYRAHGGNAGRGRYGLAAEAAKITAETRGLLQQLLIPRTRTFSLRRVRRLR